MAKQLSNRLKELENRENPDKVDEVEIRLCSEADHVHHPERYDWNKVEEQPGLTAIAILRPTPKN